MAQKTKIHLAPHGPAPCRVDWSNSRTTGCPFGGSEIHFDTMADAERAYAEKMETEGSGAVAESLRSTPSQSFLGRYGQIKDGTFLGESVSTVALDIPLDGATELALDRLVARGFRPLVVGGSVRDTLLGRSQKDFDIEVHGAESFDDLRKALSTLGPLNSTGKSFGVLKLRVKLSDGSLSEELDISLPRRDSKTGEGHRGFTVEVDPQMSLLEATARRDLTVNALCWDRTSGLAMDLHGGFSDMEQGTLRHVSSAFSEDPLRVLRVARFAAKLGFDPAEETVELSRNLSDTFKELPSERITGELGKMILEPNQTKAFGFLRDSGWSKQLGLTGEAERPEKSLERGLSRGAEVLKDRDSRKVLQMAILGSKAADPRKVIGNFAASGAELKRSLNLVSSSSDLGSSDRAARQWAWDNPSITAREKIALEDSLQPAKSAELKKRYERFRELAVLDGPEKDRFDSQSLIAAHRAANPGIKDGPWIRTILQENRDLQYGR